MYMGDELKHDIALVSYINHEVVKRSLPFEKLLSVTWDDLNPKKEELVCNMLSSNITSKPSKFIFICCIIDHPPGYIPSITAVD